MKTLENKNVKTDSTSLPWLPKEEEPLDEFAAFEYFLSIGPGRNLRDVSSKLGIELNKIKRWSAKWDWLERAKKHDALKYEICKNKQLSEIEVRNREVEQLRIKFSLLSKRALLELMENLDHYWANYNNKELRTKINHINRLTSTINNLINFAHIDLSPEHEILLSNMNIEINNILNLNNDVINVKNEKNNIFNYLDYDDAVPMPPKKEYGEECPLPELPPDLR